MSPLGMSLIVFALVFGGALVGIALRQLLPEHHLNADSRTALTMSQGVVGTMSALVLGLLVASAQGSYEMQRNELTEASAKIILLDHMLVHYGPETNRAREALRATVAGAIEQTWGKKSRGTSGFELKTEEGEPLFEKILELSPKDDTQRALKAQALNLALELGRARFLIYEQGSNSVSMPLLIVVIFWIAIIFVSFGLVSPTNATVVCALLLTALSVSGAVFLILELYQPFHGLVQLSSAPLRNALVQLAH